MFCFVARILEMKKKIFRAACVCLMFVSCVKDRTFQAPAPSVPVGDASHIGVGTLRINEFVATGSIQTNELETVSSDWFEVFNTTNDTIQLEGGHWFVTDTLGLYNKWAVPDTFILPRGFLVFWCDAQDAVITQMHTNFKLSGSGEQLGLYYSPADSTKFAIDSLSYGAQTSSESTARFPDGTTNWIVTFNNTPGNPNQE